MNAKKIGVLLLSLGALLLVGGLAAFFSSFFLLESAVTSAMHSETAGTVPLEVGKIVTSEPIEVNTDQHCKIRVDLDVRSSSVKKKSNSSKDEEEYELLYRFPLKIRVLDEAGNEIESFEHRLSNDSGLRTWSNESVDATGGSATISHHLSTFKIEESQRVVIEAELEPDDRFNAAAKSADLVLLDNVSASSKTATSGISMLCGGPFIAVLGVMLMIAGLIVTWVGKSQRAA